MFVADDLAWYVLLEETAGFGRDSYRWMLTRKTRCEDRDKARTLAYSLAKEYKPEHPMNQRGREVFQIGNDTWVVEVAGATTDFHFRVSVAAKLVG
ncbi:hypothetical protein JCM33774_17950 [Actinophytocola sp. KF-1]